MNVRSLAAALAIKNGGMDTRLILKLKPWRATGNAVVDKMAEHVVSNVLLISNAKKTLVSMLSNKDADARLSGARVLIDEKEHHPEARKALELLLADPGNAMDARLSAARELAKRKKLNSESQRTLISLFSDKNNDDIIRFSAADALSDS